MNGVFLDLVLCKLIYVLSIVADVPQRFSQLAVSAGVRGIAQLGNEIYVSTDSSTSIAVFVFNDGQQNFTERKAISFHQLKSAPRDIAASAQFQQLLVADLDAQCVWQAQRSLEGHWIVEGL